MVICPLMPPSSVILNKPLKAVAVALSGETVEVFEDIIIKRTENKNNTV